jgi:hypothetical protein
MYPIFRIVRLTPLLLISPLVAQATVTGFEDLPLSAEFAPGEVIHSQGLSFDVVDLSNPPLQFERTMQIREVAGSNALRMGKYLSFGKELGFVFKLPVTTQHVAVAYSSYDFNAGLIINGSPTSLADGFSDFDGVTIDGVAIHTAILSDLPGFEEGWLFLNGPITSLAIRGTELSIDNVTVLVPEPSTLVLILAMSGSVLLTIRRWARC